MRGLFLALLLAGCAASAPMQDGETVRNPPQWTEYCQSMPQDPAC